MDVKLPDGTVVQNVPDDITKAELTNRLVGAGMGGSLSSAEDRKMADPTRDMGTVERVRAGYGKFVSDLGRGARQLVEPQSSTLSGLVTGDTRSGLQQEIDESKKLDAPLMSTAGGLAGNIAGGIVTAAPALMVPGANTLVGAGLVGAAQGALQPVETGGSRAVNTGIGAGGGVVGQAVGNKISSVASNAISNMATRQGQNAVRDATLTAGRNAGYVVPPSAVEPGFWTNRLESVAGKSALGQEASFRNQQVTNQLVRDELGMGKNQAISEGALEAIRRTEGQAYAKVAALSQNADDALKELKQARFETTANFKHYQRSADPAALAKAQKAQADAATWEQFLEQEAISAGKQDLVPGLREARTKIAKTYDVERALNPNTGDVDAKVLARAIDQGKPLTGGLETAGRFAGAFPRYMAEGAPAAGVSKLEGGLATLLGTVGAGSMGPAGGMLAALPLASPAVRSALLSGAGQRLAGVPSYQPGGLTQLLSRPETGQGLGLLLSSGGLATTR